MVIPVIKLGRVKSFAIFLVMWGTIWLLLMLLLWLWRWWTILDCEMPNLPDILLVPLSWICVCGVSYWRSKGKGLSCVAVRYLTPLLGYSILPPRWLVDVTPCPRKSPKELYTRRQLQIGDEGVSFILSFINGFNNYFMGEGIFPEYNWNGWIPQLRCQKYVNRFLHMLVLIWYLGLP